MRVPVDTQEDYVEQLIKPRLAWAANEYLESNRQMRMEF